MASTTGRLVATKALRRIGVVGQGQSPAVADLNEAYSELNDMIDEWATDELTIFVTERAVFALVSGTQTYTLGPGGTFNRARPETLDKISVISNSNPTQPLEIPLEVLDLLQYQNLPIKNVASALPMKVYRDFNSPLMNITFWPKPNIGTLQVALYCPTALTAFTGLDVAYSIPPGYKNALSYNLAIRLCDTFGRNPPATLPKLAEDALGSIRRMNIRPEIVPVDNALVGRTGRYNYRTDQGA